MRYYITLLICLYLSLDLSAQSNESWQEYLGRIGQVEDVDRGQLEQLYDDLDETYQTKIDINTCTREELLQLPFLSEQQVMDIMEYRYKAGRIQSLMELYLVPSLERTDILRLNSFLIVSPEAEADTLPSLRNLLMYGKQEVTADFNLPFYERQGDKDGYLGYKYKHWLRYSFNYRQQVKFGLVGSQDAGEPFFAGQNKAGYDYYSFYLLIRDVHRLKTIAIGRYRLRFGMGLILNNSYGFGKLTTLNNLYASSSAITANSSRSESLYLQGAAACIDLGRGFSFTPFISYRKIDATLDKDSSSVVTILTSGYHRTKSEMQRRRNTDEFIAGGNLHFFSNGFHVGATAFYTTFNRELKLNSGPTYRHWYPNGKSFWNTSIDYGYVSNRLNIKGETATGYCHEVATINTISYSLNSQLSLMALQRYYPYRYFSLYAESFSEGGTANDESGVFVGGKWTPWRNAELQLYTDISYFAWPKYGVSTSSHRWDNFIQLATTGKTWSFLARYRLKMKENDNSDKTALIKSYTHRGRIATSYSSKVWMWKAQTDMSYVSGETNSFGYMLSTSLCWQWRWLKITGSGGYFHTDDYQSRVYSFEPGMLYSFYFPSFSGKGFRGTLNVRAKVSKQLLLVAKLATTHYFDRDVISSGLQQIDSSSQTNLELQLKWNFTTYKPKLETASQHAHAGH